MGLFCTGCDQVDYTPFTPPTELSSQAGCNQVDYTPSTPPTEISSHVGSSASPTDQPGSHAGFDLNILPPEEEMEVIILSDDEDDDDVSVMIIED